MDLGQYLDIFIEESKEHLQVCNHQLLLLERQPNNHRLVDEIFRAAHTLKGMAATMEFEDITQLTHEMENVLDEIRHRRLPVTPVLLDSIFQMLDALEEKLLLIEKGSDGTVQSRAAVLESQNSSGGRSETINHQEAAPAKEGRSIALFEYASHERFVMEEAVKRQFNVYHLEISLREDCQMKAARALLVFRLLESMGEIIRAIPAAADLEQEPFERMFTATITTKKDIAQVHEKIMDIAEVERVRIRPISLNKLLESSPVARKEHSERLNILDKPIQKSIRVNIERLDGLMSAFEELIIYRSRLEKLAQEIDHPRLIEAVSGMAGTTAEMQSILLNMRMVPAEDIFNRFPAMVRRLSKELDKEVRLEITGAATEIDRSIINEVGDSVLHFLRNALDHGIENPKTRKQSGKPSEGTIAIRAYNSGNDVMVEIEDDGAGIDEEVIVRRAVELGIVSSIQADRMSAEEKLQLIFASGFSTAQQISDISGRGVGLDAVKTMIESLGGEVMVQSMRGVGSRFTIKLPLTLSMLPALLVKTKSETYAFPLISVIDCLMIEGANDESGIGSSMIYQGESIPIIHLGEVFGLCSSSLKDTRKAAVLVIQKGNKLAAIAVDEFIGQQEIAVKPLESKADARISGKAILGGKPVWMVDVQELLFMIHS
ncbi:chemotaxis protein CheA [Pradoshia sp.]|uniref:chemotaxis protein CheA n=1 Tax=Pradoshia sp. TaxID=2651281 RepID=UPI003F007DC1